MFPLSPLLNPLEGGLLPRLWRVLEEGERLLVGLGVEGVSHQCGQMRGTHSDLTPASAFRSLARCIDGKTEFKDARSISIKCGTAACGDLSRKIPPEGTPASQIQTSQEPIPADPVSEH